MIDYMCIYAHDYYVLNLSCYPQFLGITKEMMSRGPQVADMEYRETT
jgi:hypothetical protein